MSLTPKHLEDFAGLDCSGTQVLLTGSTSGIGRASALALGRLGASVIVHGRDADAGARVVEELEAIGAEARFLAADFADSEAVWDLAATIKAETDGLDVLINNAGGIFPEARFTDRGVEYTFQVNHLAPYLLTAELLDHLRPGARVVTTASEAHRLASLDTGRVTRATNPGGHRSELASALSPTGIGSLTRAQWAYGHSKLANVLFAGELADRLAAAERAVVSNSVHPGAIPGTGFARSLPGPLSRAADSLEALPGTASIEDGAAALLSAALAPRTAEVSGRYFAGREPTLPSAAARDPEAARRLWRRSATLLGIDEPLAGYGHR